MNNMKQIIATLFIALLIFACEDNTVDPVSDKGTIYVESTPTGAEIWLDDVNTNEVTPATIEATEGVHVLTLKKSGYADLPITVSVIANQQFTLTSAAQTTLAQLGTLALTSEPAGATIWLDGENTGEVTPKNFSVESGNHTVTLQFTDYSDTTFITQVTGTGTVTENIFMRPNFITMHKAKIWESYGTSAAQPSGLDLSSGLPYGTSDVDNRGKIDIYYFSNSAGTSFLVQSSHLNANMSRETFFKVMAATNLNDRINSPVKSGDWAYSVNESENNYMFLFDADNHYSKLRITNRGGLGTSDDPAWVEVQWYYNENENSVAF
ncbi:MAG: PEGA domain-containing protein [Melioribacteraceae bacterium]|nr:PEGA domain-containing protein [Melioribacteraceae bacterium]